VRAILLELGAEGSGGNTKAKKRGNIKGRGGLRKSDRAGGGDGEQQKGASNVITPLNEQRILAFLILYERVSGYPPHQQRLELGLDGENAAFLAQCGA
jgi:hypothetical protein